MTILQDFNVKIGKSKLLEIVIPLSFQIATDYFKSKWEIWIFTSK